MWLILTNENDKTATWVQKGLERRGLEQVYVLEASALVNRARWYHRLGRDGLTLTLHLADGLVIPASRVSGMLNRLMRLPIVRSTRPGERVYARNEWAVYFTSWLNSLTCPVLNRVTTHGLCGTGYSLMEWKSLAEEAGLKAYSYRRVNTDKNMMLALPAHEVFVIGEQVIAAPGQVMPERIRQGCLQLAFLASMQVIGIEFDADWTFVGATLLPDLRRGGDVVLNALTQALRYDASLETSEISVPANI